jgi:hypothetical protein
MTRLRTDGHLDLAVQATMVLERVAGEEFRPVIFQETLPRISLMGTSTTLVDRSRGFQELPINCRRHFIWPENRLGGVRFRSRQPDRMSREAAGQGGTVMEIRRKRAFSG